MFAIADVGDASIEDVPSEEVRGFRPFSFDCIAGEVIFAFFFLFFSLIEEVSLNISEKRKEMVIVSWYFHSRRFFLATF